MNATRPEPDRIHHFQCPTCGRVKSYPPSPAGPSKPYCSYGHRPFQMYRVEVTRKDTEGDTDA